MSNHKKQALAINLNLNVRGLAPSSTLAINERSNQLINQGRTIYKLVWVKALSRFPKGLLNPQATCT
jgi:hypothetical protein